MLLTTRVLLVSLREGRPSLKPSLPRFSPAIHRRAP
jgi:hypothetical protein